MVQIDMEMPKSCSECLFMACDFTCNCYVADCYEVDVGDYDMKRHPYCPLMGVNDKLDGDTIDIDKAIEHYKGTLQMLKDIGFGVDE